MAFHKKIEKEWFSVDEIARKYSFSRSFIISQIKEGKLKAFHPGRIYKVHQEWLNEWVENNIDGNAA